MNDIFISVIINSYRRKEYLKEAVISVLNQNIDRKKYEIIVVKGFYDKDIDDFLEVNGINNIYVEGLYNGKRWIEGIKKSKGEVICFLDDDDMFSSLKLDRIYNIYEDAPFEYYHNSYTSDPNLISKEGDDYLFLQNDHGSITLHKFLKYSIKYKLSINSSSICIVKHIIADYLNESEQVTVGWDVYLFYLYLSHAKNFVIDNTLLTYYRQHNSYSHHFDNILEFRERELSRNKDADGAYKLYRDIVTQKFLKKTLEYEAFSYEIPLYICDFDRSKSPKTMKLFQFLLNARSYSVKFRFVYFSLGILSKLSKSYAFNLYFYLNKKKIL
jgi:glycosyltransferase involved in cell wall biosynthesis